jgi:leader peptidase (prepilin peptidase)/N-methyltransferase
MTMADPAIAAIAPYAALLLGLIVGSFLNVVILRLPDHMRAELAEACADLQDQPYEPAANRLFGLDFLIKPASSCPKCGHGIRAWENIPVLSWLLLRGRCSSCKAAISVRYPIVEATTGLLSLLVVWHFGATAAAAAALLLVWTLIALTVIDLDEQLLPDQLTLPMVWLGLLVNINGTFTDLTSAVIGAVAGYLTLWLVFQLFRLVTGREGMGYGDFKLLAVFGAFLGWQLLPLVILLSSLVGAVVGISLVVLRGRDRQIPIPFGPYLAVAGLIALVWGEQINQGYLQLTGLA